MSATTPHPKSHPRATGGLSASSPKQKSSDVKKIVHQKHRITELKELLEYYKEITQTVRQPFIILDKDLRVLTANVAFYRKFKVLKKDTVGKLVYNLGNKQWDAPELRVLLEHILPKHRVMNNYSVTHDFPVVGSRTILLNARQVDSKQLILLAMEDVTSYLKLREGAEGVTANLIRQRDQLQDLNEAKDEFISLASHQLRTPATIVKQYVGMLKGGYAGKLAKEQISMLNVVDNSNDRQLEIIEDLLRVAKVDAGKVYLEKKPCDVMKQVRVVIKEQRVLFKGRGQKVTLYDPHRKVIALIDPKLMLMVIENLLDNAGKYSPKGGHIKVTVGQNGKFTIISIKDSGVGISVGDHKKLFKKFSRIDNPLSASVKGTGLGLYWAKKILDLHNGSIVVESRLGHGSTFTVKIPVELPRIAISAH